MLNIIIQKLKEQFRGVVIYTTSTVGYVLLMFALFPMMQKMDLQSLINSYPKDVAKFFSSSGMLNYNTISGFISMEYLSFFFILILIGYVGSAAGSAIAGQIEKRTLDFNLSQPVSRTKFVLAEAIVAMKYSAIIVLINSFAMYISGKIFHAELKTDGLIAFTVTAIFFVWALYGIAIFLSSILKSKITVVLGTFGIILASYIFGSLARIVDKLSRFEKISLFHLYNPEQLLNTGAFDWHQIIILFCVFLIGLISAIVIFNRKDV